MIDKMSDIAKWSYGEIPEIIEATKESLTAFSEKAYGQGTIVLYREHIAALLEGKALAHDGGEFTTVVMFVPEGDKSD